MGPLKGIDFMVSSGKDFDPSDPSFLPFLFLTSMASMCLQLWVVVSSSQNLMYLVHLAVVHLDCILASLSWNLIAEDYWRACHGMCRLFICLNINE